MKQQKSEWQEFADVTGFSYTWKQLAFGAALGASLLGVCALIEWIRTFF